eukprot:COSAG06_NODE_240_length_19339_cov_16.770582_6_plen_64_part_00
MLTTLIKGIMVVYYTLYLMQVQASQVYVCESSVMPATLLPSSCCCCCCCCCCFLLLLPIAASR